jgi:hypothetical protein
VLVQEGVKLKSQMNGKLFGLLRLATEPVEDEHLSGLWKEAWSESERPDADPSDREDLEMIEAQVKVCRRCVVLPVSDRLFAPTKTVAWCAESRIHV